jgi:hypothetical protein
MTGGGLGWQKRGVGHELFFTEKGGSPKNIGLKGGGSSCFTDYSGENLTCNDYCYCRERAGPSRLEVWRV